MYEIGVSMLFINTAGVSSNVMTPMIQIGKSTSGTVTIVNNQHFIVPSIRINYNIGTTSTIGILQLNANDLVRFKLLINVSTPTTFIALTSNFATTSLSISVRYLGNYNEYIV